MSSQLWFKTRPEESRFEKNSLTLGAGTNRFRTATCFLQSQWASSDSKKARRCFMSGVRGPPAGRVLRGLRDTIIWPTGKVKGWYVVMTLNASALLASNSPAHQPMSRRTCLLCAVKRAKKNPPRVETHLYSPPRVSQFTCSLGDGHFR